MASAGRRPRAGGGPKALARRMQAGHWPRIVVRGIAAGNKAAP